MENNLGQIGLNVRSDYEIKFGVNAYMYGAFLFALALMLLMVQKNGK